MSKSKQRKDYIKYASIGKFILKLYVHDSLLRELRELKIP